MTARLLTANDGELRLDGHWLRGQSRGLLLLRLLYLMRNDGYWNSGSGRTDGINMSRSGNNRRLLLLILNVVLMLELRERIVRLNEGCNWISSYGMGLRNPDLGVGSWRSRLNLMLLRSDDLIWMSEE